MANAAKRLTYDEAMTKSAQVDELLNDFHARMTSAKNGIQDLVGNRAAAGQYMALFGERWNENCDAMFNAYSSLKRYNEVCRQNYQETHERSQSL